MTTAVQRRRGTNTEHATFTGLDGEITVNTTTYTLHVHDGATVGGIVLAKADGSNIVTSSIDINGGTIDGTVIGGSSAAAGTFTSITGTSANIDGAVTTGDITIDNDDTPTLNFKKDSSADILGTINVSTDAGSGGKMVFQTKRNGNTALDRMVIDDDGKVGIGTTSPAQALDVASGNVKVGLAASFITYTQDYGIGTPNASGLQVFAANGDVIKLGHMTGGTTFTERARIDSSGNVGIGTTDLTDSYKTIIEGSDQETGNLTDSGAHGATLFLRATGDGVGSGGAVAFGTHYGNKRPFAAIKGFITDGTANSIGHLVFSTRATTSATELSERLRITDAGNVGIGTTSPAGKVHISDSSADKGYIFRDGKIDFVNASNSAFSTGNFQAASFYFQGGNVGIGTASPAAKLEIGGAGEGIILASPDGTRYEITVANGGTLTVTAV